MNLPNTGLAYISASLKEGHKIIDQAMLPSPKDRFLAYKSNWFGVSVKMATYPEAIRISKLYKAKNPTSTIVWGGPQISCDSIGIKLANPDIELFVGEWDHTKDLDSLPFPDYSKFDSYGYLVKSWQTGRIHYPIITSRGCPYNCLYCSSHLITGKKWRARSAQNCCDELKQAKQKHHIKYFEILDDCFNLDMNRVIEFCNFVKPLKLSWSCPNGIRADRFNDDVAKAMFDSGCRHVSFGIESADPEILKSIKKGETIEQIEHAIDIAKRYYKSVSGYLIIGLPKSTYEKDLQSLHWALEKGIRAHFSYLVPFKGTELYDVYYKGASSDKAIFFGQGAHPVSNAYPKELQKRIYDLTEYMRGDRSKLNLIRKPIISLKSIVMYDRGNLEKHFGATSRILKTTVSRIRESQ